PSVPFSWEAFVRWTAMGAMTPFMQLHGRANLSPWSMPERADETVEIYRYWSVLHQALIPFWYSLAEQAYREGAEPIMRPLKERPEAWAGDWRYRLGEAFLVAPHFEAGGRRAVELPEGRWYDWWALDADPLIGGERLMVDHSEEPLKMPIYLPAGAIVPFSIETEAQQALIDLRALPAHHTILATPPERGVSRFILFEADEQPTEIELRAGAGEMFTLTFSRLHEGALVAIPLSASLSVALLGAAGDGEAVVARGDWTALAEREEVALWWEEERSRLWVRLKPSNERLTLRFESRVE
ncbi:MAG: TIM-barrel domain-containing protein, partial [Myxococcota bacterium]|nr:TIM-barrel domain-containing protein [Myxococcota bacterium]